MSLGAGTLSAIIRPHAAGGRAATIDLLTLIGCALLLVATGLGLRDPWPADEPRFALIARDMVRSGNWLVPMIGGDLYQDKPPLYFWLLALGYLITGSLRGSFLLPSLFATIGTTLLVYDLGRRLYDRASGFAAAFLLLVTFQFVWQGRQAQIDATLAFWITLSLYGLLRHLLKGPAWGWYTLAWAAAGLGVITKGVGFLALLVLAPYALLRAPRWQPRPPLRGGWRWALGPLALLAAVGAWLVPMLIVSLDNPALAAYRDEILLKQTLERYASAWHHHEPFWYYVLEVIPGLWLPITVLLPWLVPWWKRALAAGDLRIALALAWVAIVLLFFSVSAGKRGVYVLPALPALALAAGPALVALRDRRGPALTMYLVATLIVTMLAGVAAFVVMDRAARVDVLREYGIDPLWPLAMVAALGILLLVLLRPCRGFLAYGSMLALLMVVIGFWINPRLDDIRSGQAFAREVRAALDEPVELGIAGYREQYLLALDRPLVNFGHRRWRSGTQEAADAARWLSAAPGRVLLVDRDAVAACFEVDAARFVTEANRKEWYLVTGGARPECVERGDPAAARSYDPQAPPGLALNAR